MRIAALYDIHGNLPALEAVMQDVEAEKVDCIVIGGDALAGPMPVETLDYLQALDCQSYFLKGNSESDILEYLQVGSSRGLTPSADANAKWIAEKLNQEQRHFLSTWSDTVTLETEAIGEILFCHATPNSNTYIFTSQTSEETLLPHFANLTTQTVVCGHTHMQFDKQVGKTRIVNAGSVGMPFGKTGAYWLLIDNDIKFMSTHYDLALAAEHIKQSDDPDAEDFAMNNVLQVPTKEQALAMMTTLAKAKNEEI